MSLPPGQFNLEHFPRFGLPPYAKRFPAEIEQISLKVSGDVDQENVISDEFDQLPRITQTSDFHCVTSWSCTGLCWEGWRFSDFYNQVIVPSVTPETSVSHAIFVCHDGYSACLPLVDLMADDVLLADRLNGEPLTLAHGAPLRLVAPAHYGYKNTKHLKGIKLVSNADAFIGARPKFLTHPRGRVAYEERGAGVSGKVLRYLYKPLIRPNICIFQQALAKYQSKSKLGNQ